MNQFKIVARFRKKDKSTGLEKDSERMCSVFVTGRDRDEEFDRLLDEQHEFVERIRAAEDILEIYSVVAYEL